MYSSDGLVDPIQQCIESGNASALAGLVSQVCTCGVHFSHLPRTELTGACVGCTSQMSDYRLTKIKNARWQKLQQFVRRARPARAMHLVDSQHDHSALACTPRF